ncbi:MAG: DUF616 domain-containing protein [Chloroflexi bacterium]|nr:DUF616 domain-containing protein [Chloroflexota bacterium]
MLTVYTAIVGGRDRLRPPVVRRPDVHYVAFMDGQASVEGWDIRQAETRFGDPVVDAKAHKVWPHVYLDAALTLWVDGTHLPTEAFVDAVPSLLATGDIALFAHPWRDCLYAEGAVCRDALLDIPERIQLQLADYAALGFPLHQGLYAGGVILRRDSHANRQLSRLWWQQIRRYSKRDQISLPFALRRLKVSPVVIPGHVYRSRWFDYQPH